MRSFSLDKSFYLAGKNAIFNLASESLFFYLASESAISNLASENAFHLAKWECDLHTYVRIAFSLK